MRRRVRKVCRCEAWPRTSGRVILRFMTLLSRLNSKFGRYGVPNVTVILIIGQAFLYVAQQVNPAQGNADVLDKIRMVPESVLAGEVWRLVTFLFDPPLTILIFAA